MNLLFVYEDKVAQDTEGNYYVGSAFSQSVFDRYLQVFDNMTLIMRKAAISSDDIETLNRMNRITDSRIKVLFMPNTKESIKAFLSISARREVRKLIKENVSKDCAVIVRMCSESGFLASKYCRKIKKPYLAEAVGCPWDSLTNHSLKGKILAPFAWMKMRYSMKHAAYAIYVTSEFLQRRYPTLGKQAAISDVELQPVDETVLEKRLEKIRNHSGKYLIGTAAAVNVAFKGQRFVIEALAKLKAEGNTNFEYHLAGGGDNTVLKNLAETLCVSDQIVFEGSIPHDKMFAWLDNLDLYIQPSLVEAMPRALIEAMSRGLPCFATSIGGMPELVATENIFQPKDVDAICKSLKNISKQQLTDSATKAFAKAKDFDKQLLAKKRDEFLKEFAETEGER